MSINGIEKIINEKYYSVFKHQCNDMYYLKLNSTKICDIKSIFNSFTQNGIIVGTSVVNNYEYVLFKSSCVESITEYLEIFLSIDDKIAINTKYEFIINIIYCLVIQLKYLIEYEKKTFIGYKMENILVIDKTKFIYIDTDFIQPIKHENIQILYPLSPSLFFLSPEILTLCSVPNNVNFKSVYYSFGLVILKILSYKTKYMGAFDNDIYVKTQNKSTYTLNEVNITNYLEKLTIKNTKLYFFLKRALSIDTENRSLLFI